MGIHGDSFLVAVRRKGPVRHRMADRPDRAWTRTTGCGRVPDALPGRGARRDHAGPRSCRSASRTGPGERPQGHVHAGPRQSRSAGRGRRRVFGIASVRQTRAPRAWYGQGPGAGHHAVWSWGRCGPGERGTNGGRAGNGPAGAQGEAMPAADRTRPRPSPEDRDGRAGRVEDVTACRHDARAIRGAALRDRRRKARGTGHEDLLARLGPPAGGKDARQALSG